MIKKQFPIDESDDDTLLLSESSLPKFTDETMTLRAAVEKLKIPNNLLIDNKVNQ